ncbi:MAG: hypothetical protein IKW30_10925 [Lachnospiraceae bacterium]|nr:hypothetical protein [Lachnospiraceae bacterium]
MVKIDKRRKYMLVLDTETCNSIDEPLVYDLGMAVVDKNGTIYETESLIIKEIFYGESELMKSSYYAKKLPQYFEDIKNGSRVVVPFYMARQKMIALMEKYGIDTVCAYNARFDFNALNTTQRWLTKSKYRFFFPYGTEIWDILKMATDTICRQKMYSIFCKENDYLTGHPFPQNKRTAEVVYRYLYNDTDFIESHTALEDVSIENEIMSHCFRQHKKMRKSVWA